MTIEQILPTSPLSDPSHSSEHNRINTQLTALRSEHDALAAQAPVTAQNIDQARLTASFFMVHGQVMSGVNLLMPIHWNMTGRVVEYEAARATIFTPPQGQSILVDLVTGTTLEGGEYDLTTMTSILATPLEIPAGENTSIIYTDDNGDFLTDQPIGSFVAAYVLQAGTDPDTGADLSIQLNRKL